MPSLMISSAVSSASDATRSRLGASSAALSEPAAALTLTLSSMSLGAARGRAGVGTRASGAGVGWRARCGGEQRARRTTEGQVERES